MVSDASDQTFCTVIVWNKNEAIATILLPIISHQYLMNNQDHLDMVSKMFFLPLESLKFLKCVLLCSLQFEVVFFFVNK